MIFKDEFFKKNIPIFLKNKFPQKNKWYNFHIDCPYINVILLNI